MSRGIRITPERYQRISMKGDSLGRTHHAVIFNTAKLRGANEKRTFVARCKLPKIFTWTPTGHGAISNWDFARSEKSEQLSGEELALLVPRSLWVWFVPDWMISKKSKIRLFYLETHK